MPKATNEIASRSALASTEIGAAPVAKLLLGVEVTINSTTINSYLIKRGALCKGSRAEESLERQLILSIF